MDTGTGLTPANSRQRTRPHRVTAGVLLAAVVALLPTSAGAATPTPVTYRGHTYAGAGKASAEKPQSKLWYNAGSWWALMVSAGTSGNKVTVHELMADHTWRNTGAVVDNRPDSTGDALWDGTSLYVASRGSGTGAAVHAVKLAYDRATRTYATVFTKVIVTSKSESATIAKDSLGRLWITYTSGSPMKVYVAHSTTSETTWTAPFSPNVPDVEVNSDDLSAIISFSGKVGVMWSDQGVLADPVDDTFRFAVHPDGAPDDSWSIEQPLAGSHMADDHINLKGLVGDEQGRIFAAIKTSQGDGGEPTTSPLVAVLTRSSTGTWSTAVAGTVADRLTRPIIMIDENSKELYFFATSPDSGSTKQIYYKKAPLSNVAFGPGRGAPFVSCSTAAAGTCTASGTNINDPSGTKDPVNATTGLVVLASDETARRYYHAELALDGSAPPPADTQAPSVPANLRSTAASSTRVDLSWSASTDNVGVMGYAVYRDGTSVGTSTTTSFADTAAAPGTTYSYTVDAYDAAGNRSARSAPASATTPDAPPPTSGAIVLRGASNNVNAGATALVIPTPAGVSAGDVMIASVDVRTTPTITAPVGWTLIRRDAVTSTTAKATYYRIAGSAEPASYTWTFSATRAAAGGILTFGGVSTASPIDASGGQANPTVATTFTAPSVTTTVPGAMLVGLFGAAVNATVTPPQGMAEQWDRVATTAPNPELSAAAIAVQADAGPTGTRAATATTAAASVGQLIALRPAA